MRMATRVQADYVRKLEVNLKSLDMANIQLGSDYYVIKTKVEDEEKLPRKRTVKVASWIETVKNLLEDVKTTLEEGNVEKQKKCLGGGCPKNCWSSYKLGKIMQIDR